MEKLGSRTGSSEVGISWKLPQKDEERCSSGNNCVEDEQTCVMREHSPGGASVKAEWVWEGKKLWPLPLAFQLPTSTSFSFTARSLLTWEAGKHDLNGFRLPVVQYVGGQG